MTWPDRTRIQRTLGQFGRFAVVGVLNTIVDLAVLNAETILSGVKEGRGYAVQKGSSFLVAVAFSYAVNRRWTFGNSGTAGRGKGFPRFLFVSLMGALVNVGTATALVTYVKDLAAPSLGVLAMGDQIWVNLGALGGTTAGFLWNFLGYKLLVFRGVRS